MSGITRARSATLQKFTGGLNNFWDQSSIADNELADIINFEFSTNGSLISRPPIYVDTDAETDNVYTPVAGEPFDILGNYVRQDGVRFLVAVTNSKTWIFNVLTKAWTQIASFKASDCTQYLNKIVLSSTTAGQGGYWESGTFHTTSTMPALGGIELFQTRFFGYGVQGTTTANIMYWTQISTAGPAGETTSVWDWNDTYGNAQYVEIGGGDGQWITAIAQGYNDIVIFRNRSTYRYSFSDLPEEGQMQVMQQDIGAENRRCVVKFENAHFVLSGETLYKYQNWLYYPLNAQRVKFESYETFTQRFKHAISIVERRCLVWHNGSLYSYNLDTDTWSEWHSDSHIAYFASVPRRSEEDAETLYFGVSGDADQTQTGVSDFAMYRIEDKPYSDVGSEQFICSLQTKIYDFETPVEWKRLYYWSADIAAAGTVKAVVYPVILPESLPTPYWDELSKDFDGEASFYTWDQISKDDLSDVFYGTWDSIITPSGGIQSLVSAPIPTVVKRMEIKLNQSLRFRRVYFELYLESGGTPTTAPAQVYSITPMVGVKAKVAKGAN